MFGVCGRCLSRIVRARPTSGMGRRGLGHMPWSSDNSSGIKNFRLRSPPPPSSSSSPLRRSDASRSSVEALRTQPASQPACPPFPFLFTCFYCLFFPTSSFFFPSLPRLPSLSLAPLVSRLASLGISCCYGILLFHLHLSAFAASVMSDGASIPVTVRMKCLS